jgi:serine/threonine-protein kinase
MSEQYREPEAKKTAPFKDEAPVESIVVDKATESKPALVERSDGPMRRPSPRNRDPFVGTTLNDRYHVLSLIGEGATSAVYKAEDTKLNEAVAIKILHSHLAADATIMRRFEQEAKTSRLLRHPNIVDVRSYEKSDDGIPYLVMDLAEGTSLQDVLKASGWLPADQTIAIFIQVCAALSAAHENGVVHRDLKPSNIMLTDAPDGNLLVKVLDFGVAKILPATGDTVLKLTQTGEMLGSILYMSPEQCLDEDLDGRSDCYSLGCVMYETLTGKPPLLARTAFETMNKHMSDMPERLDRVRPDLKWSPGLQHIIFKAMAKDPNRRYQKIVQLQDELEKLATGTQMTIKQLKGNKPAGRGGKESLEEQLTTPAKNFPDTHLVVETAVWVSGLICFWIIIGAAFASELPAIVGFGLSLLLFRLLQRPFNLPADREQSAIASAQLLIGGILAGVSLIVFNLPLWLWPIWALVVLVLLALIRRFQSKTPAMVDQKLIAEPIEPLAGTDRISVSVKRSLPLKKPATAEDKKLLAGTDRIGILITSVDIVRSLGHPDYFDLYIKGYYGHQFKRLRIEPVEDNSSPWMRLCIASEVGGDTFPVDADVYIDARGKPTAVVVLDSLGRVVEYQTR